MKVVQGDDRRPFEKMVTLNRWSYMTGPFPGGRRVTMVNSQGKSKGRVAGEMATCVAKGDHTLEGNSAAPGRVILIL